MKTNFSYYIPEKNHEFFLWEIYKILNNYFSTFKLYSIFDLAYYKDSKSQKKRSFKLLNKKRVNLQRVSPKKSKNKTKLYLTIFLLTFFHNLKIFFPFYFGQKIFHYFKQFSSSIFQFFLYFPTSWRVFL